VHAATGARRLSEAMAEQKSAQTALFSPYSDVQLLTLFCSKEQMPSKQTAI
jgi:hypothetical protein